MPNSLFKAKPEFLKQEKVSNQDASTRDAPERGRRFWRLKSILKLWSHMAAHDQQIEVVGGA